MKLFHCRKNRWFATAMALAVWHGGTALAQPAGQDAEQADRKALTELRKKVAAVDNSDLAAARLQSIELYKEFIAAHPNIYPSVGIAATQGLVSLYQKAKLSEPALQALDAGLQKYATDADAILLLNTKASVLISDKKFGDAETMLRGLWEKSLQQANNDEAKLIVPYVTALTQQGKTAEAANVARKVLTEAPMYLEAGQGASERLFSCVVEHLLADQRDEEALGWAKLRFMTCAFSESAIASATNLLSRVWMARDLAPTTAQAFIDAQKSAAAANPLTAVKLPEVSAEARKAQLVSLAAASQAGSRPAHDRISMHIQLGELGAAMAAARRIMVAQPKSSTGSLEICRVFKAADLNVKRANAFLEYIKAGQGVNPLVEFFQQYPVSAPAGEPAPAP